VDELDWDGLPKPTAPFESQGEREMLNCRWRSAPPVATRKARCARLKEDGYQRPKVGSRTRPAAKFASSAPTNAY